MKTTKSIKNIFLSATLSTLLIGCGGSTTGDKPTEQNNPSNIDNNTSSQIKSTTITGKAIDGYLQFATVCLDIDQDGYCQDKEPHAQTKKDGTFKLDITTSIQKDKSFSEAMLLVYGGRDSDTKLDFKGKLLAPQETTSVNVTPITTLVAKAVQSELTENKKLDKKEVAKKIKQAKESVAKAFGLKVEDIIKDPVAEKENIPKLIQQALKIQKSMEAISGTKDDKDSIEKKYEEFAKHIIDEVQIEKDIIELIEDAFKDEENKDAAKIIVQKIDKSFEKFDNDLEKIAFVTKEDLKKIKKGKKEEIVIQDPIFELADADWEYKYIESDYEDITGNIPTKEEMDAIKEKIGKDINQGMIKDNIEKFKDDQDFNHMYKEATIGLKSIVASKTFYLKEYDYDEKKYTIQKITFDSNGIAKFKIKNNEEMTWKVKDNFLSQRTKRSSTGTSFESQTDKYVQFQYGLRIYKSEEAIDTDISLEEKVKGKTFYLKKMSSEDIIKVVFDKSSQAPIYDENGKYAILDIDGDRITTHGKSITTEYYYNRYIDDKGDYIVLDDIGDIYRNVIDGNIIIPSNPNVKIDDNITTNPPVDNDNNKISNFMFNTYLVLNNMIRVDIENKDIAKLQIPSVDQLTSKKYEGSWKVNKNELFITDNSTKDIFKFVFTKDLKELHADKYNADVNVTFDIGNDGIDVYESLYYFGKKIIQTEKEQNQQPNTEQNTTITSATLDSNGLTNTAFKGITFVDGYSYVASREGSLLVYDTNTIEAKELPIKTLRLTKKDVFDGPHHIIEYADYLYITGGKLFIVDISDRENPKLTQTLDYTSQWNTPSISNKKLLLPESYSSTSATMFDVSDPQKPKLLSKFLTVGKAIIVDDFVYGVKNNTLTKYSLTTYNTIRKVFTATTKIDKTPYHMYSYKNLLVVATENSMYIFDTDNNLKLVKKINHGSRIFGCKENMCVVGGYVYNLSDIESAPLSLADRYLSAVDGFPFQATLDDNGWVYRGNQDNIKLDKLDFEKIVIEKEPIITQPKDNNISFFSELQKQYLGKTFFKADYDWNTKSYTKKEIQFDENGNALTNSELKLKIETDKMLGESWKGEYTANIVTEDKDYFIIFYHEYEGSDKKIYKSERFRLFKDEKMIDFEISKLIKKRSLDVIGMDYEFADTSKSSLIFPNENKFLLRLDNLKLEGAWRVDNNSTIVLTPDNGSNKITIEWKKDIQSGDNVDFNINGQVISKGISFIGA